MMKIKFYESYSKVNISPGDVKGITLLSVDEYRYNSGLIPHINESWWLRTPGYYAHSAAYVGMYGSLSKGGYSVTVENMAVRPALLINSSSITLDYGDEFTLFDHEWIVLRTKYRNKYMAICKDYLFKDCFTKSKGNGYNSSDIKKKIEDWLCDQ